MKQYEFKLNLPVEFIPEVFDDLTKYHELNLNTNLINQEFKDFLTSLNLSIDYAKHFCAIPYQKYILHRDVLDDQYGIITDNVKLNFVTGGAGSKMIWYELKPGIEPTFRKNYQGRLVPSYNKDQLIEVHRATIGWPSLLDAYAIHSLENSSETRQCWSFTLNSTITKDRISWDEAIEIFKDYLVPV